MTFPPAIQAMFDDPAYWVSNREHRTLADEFDTRFRRALAGAVECEPHLTARFLDRSGRHAQLPWLAWDDDTGGYWVAAGIQHGWPEPADDWETFAWAHYLRETPDGEDWERNEYPFHMTPHVQRDPRAVVEVVIRGLRDHRAQLAVSAHPIEGEDQ